MPPNQHPTEADRRRIAIEVVTKHSQKIMATARRHAETTEDAEDAYQRGIEILLAKAPVKDMDEVIPWLRTVVKHEAWALRRKRRRDEPVSDNVDLLERGGSAASAEEQAMLFETLGLGAKLLRELKPHEARALRLRAEGLSYNEICAETEWTYTKVNRCLTEGRASFRRKLASITSLDE